MSRDQASELVKTGYASWVIDFTGEVPIPTWDIVLDPNQQTTKDVADTVRSPYAAKTPRVKTVEKADIERAYIDEKILDIERIEEWGRLAREVIFDITIPWAADPFEGRALFCSIAADQRTSVGVSRK